MDFQIKYIPVPPYKLMESNKSLIEIIIYNKMCMNITLQGKGVINYGSLCLIVCRKGRCIIWLIVRNHGKGDAVFIEEIKRRSTLFLIILIHSCKLTSVYVQWFRLNKIKRFNRKFITKAYRTRKLKQ